MRSLFRFAALLGALPLAATLAGCDGVDVVEQPTGPVVEFGTSSLNTSEGSTVSLPVVLTGSNGQPVTVEVLFAPRATPEATRAGYEADFTDFGDARDGFQIATVTFPGTQDDTLFVTFAAVQDDRAESSESAVFALQRPVNARLGSVRDLTVSIGTPPISATRALAPTPTGGTPVIVTVQGIVTRVEGRQVFLQDESAGIALFGPAGSPLAAQVLAGEVRPGTRLEVKGRLVEFQPSTGVTGTGLLQIDLIAATDIGIISQDNPLPPAQTITLAQLTAGDPDADTWEAELVRVENLTIVQTTDAVFVAARSYTVSQTVDGVTTTGTLRINSETDTNLDGTPVPTGPFTFVGPVGQFRGGNQLVPIETDDLIPIR